MALNALKTLLVFSILGVGSATAGNYEQDYLTISSVEVRRIKKDILNQNQRSLIYLKNFQIQGLPDGQGQMDPIKEVGKVIATARDLVALGEDVYRLVIKGKPSNKTDYAPISVIPKVNGAAAEILDTEGWEMPQKQTFEVIYKNLFNMEVVKFRYSVIFAYGGSYEGKGDYLTSAQIIPESVSTLFGYDFSAKMKLGGIQNHGTRKWPVAGATLLMEYTVNTIIKASLEVSTYHITGKGGFREI